MIDQYGGTAENGSFRVSDGNGIPPFLHKLLTQADQETTRGRLRVLVVDDERLIADTVAQILNLHGYDAFSAYSGPDALKLAEQFQPDYLLTDVLMPVMNGIDLAVETQKRWPSTKVLLFSGQAGTTALIQRQRKEAVNFQIVAKPIHPEKLIESLRKLGDEHGED